VVYAVCIHTSTSIRVSDDTTEMLESLKREVETFDELLERLAQREKPIDIGAWSQAQADRAREAVERSRERFER
jgi:predicted CopG family antitoxin